MADASIFQELKKEKTLVKSIIPSFISDSICKHL